MVRDRPARDRHQRSVGCLCARSSVSLFFFFSFLSLSQALLSKFPWATPGHSGAVAQGRVVDRDRWPAAEDRPVSQCLFPYSNRETNGREKCL